jgi:hypothetical protein
VARSGVARGVTGRGFSGRFAYARLICATGLEKPADPTERRDDPPLSFSASSGCPAVMSAVEAEPELCREDRLSNPTRSTSRLFGVVRVRRQHTVSPAKRSDPVIPRGERSFGTPTPRSPPRTRRRCLSRHRCRGKFLLAEAPLGAAAPAGSEERPPRRARDRHRRPARAGPLGPCIPLGSRSQLLGSDIIVTYADELHGPERLGFGFWPGPAKNHLRLKLQAGGHRFDPGTLHQAEWCSRARASASASRAFAACSSTVTRIASG